MLHFEIRFRGFVVLVFAGCDRAFVLAYNLRRSDYIRLDVNRRVFVRIPDVL